LLWPQAYVVFQKVAHSSLFTVLSKTEFRCVILLLCAALAGAQTQPSVPTGNLDVTVLDEDGQALPAAFVLVEQAGKVILQERASPSGNALLHRLAPGKYKVLIQKPGFYTTTVDNVEIVSGQTQPMEVRLHAVRES